MAFPIVLSIGAHVLEIARPSGEELGDHEILRR